MTGEEYLYVACRTRLNVVLEVLNGLCVLEYDERLLDIKLRINQLLNECDKKITIKG